MAKVKQQELSYIDLLTMLYDDVQSDVGIPKKEKNDISRYLDALESRLFKYSA